MTGKAGKRRLRVRRRRKRDAAAEAAADTFILDTGCCLIEAVAGAALLAGLLAVPVSLLLD